MALHADVVAVLDERAADAAASRLERRFAKAGHVSAEEFDKVFSAEVGRSNIGADQLGEALKSRMARHGRDSGDSFGQSFGSQLAQSIPVISGFTSAMSGYESASGKAGAVAGRAMGMAFTTAAAGVIGAAGYTLFKGFERYEAIDAAKSRLENLNRTMEATGRAGLNVGAVMETVQQTVQGTPFSLAEAFTVATTAMSSGVTDIQRFMTDVGDAAGVAQTGIGEMGQVFTQIVNQGKVDAGMLQNQLQNIPVRAWLADTYKISGQEVTKAISDGKIGIDQLMFTIEQHAGGMGKALGDTVQGAMSNVNLAVSKIGANFLGAIFGQPIEDGNDLKDVLLSVYDRLNDVNAWVTTHQDDIRNFFEGAAEVGGDLVTVIGDVSEALGGIENFAMVAGGAFVAWKVGAIPPVRDLVGGLSKVNDKLGDMPGLAGRAAGALGPLAALAAGLYAVDAKDRLNPNDSRNLGNAGARGDWGSVAIGDAWPWLRDQLGLNNTAPPSPPAITNPGGLPGILMPGANTGGPSPTGQMTPDALANILGVRLPGSASPTGAPPPLGGGSGTSKPGEIPYPAGYGQPPQLGESTAQWQARMSSIKADHDLAEARARVTQLEGDVNATADDKVKAQNDVLEAEMRAYQTDRAFQDSKKADLAAAVPYAPGYGAGPRPGESASQYAAESSFYEAQHKRAQAEAELQQLQASGTATDAERIEASNKLLKAQNDENQAQLRLAEASKSTSNALSELGAGLDADFGISKGLSGIADNLVRFLGAIATAPLQAQLAQISAANPNQGFGLMGMLGSTGAFGQQYTPMGIAATGGLAGYAGGTTGAPTKQQVIDIAAGFGLQVTSSDRPGDPGYHGSGMALDLSNGSGNTPQMEAFANYMAQNFGTSLKELIYSDPQFSGLIGNGKNVTGTGYYDPGTLSEHKNHVHVAANWGQGGLGAPGGSGPVPVSVTNGSEMLSGFNWDAVAQKESSGNWANNDTGGNGHYGGLQFSPSTWNAYGGQQFAPMPNLATPDQQKLIADRTAFTGYNGTAPQGLGAWEVITNGSTAGDGITVNSRPPGGGGGLYPGAGFPQSGPGGPSLGPMLSGPDLGPGPGGLGGPGSGGYTPGTSPLGLPPGSGVPGAPGFGIGNSVLAQSGYNLANDPLGVPAAAGPSGGSQIGITPGGPIDTALNLGAAAIPGLGAAAQTTAKLASRTVQYGAQVAGTLADGFLQTILPAESQKAQSSWLQRGIGAAAGAKPALPNLAGKGGPPTMQPGQQQAGQAGGPVDNSKTYNTTVNSSASTIDGAAKDAEFFYASQNSGPGHY
ncbi:hypothetical protein BH09ACT8_BH09ACT8_59060 [soil metagenome]